MNFVVIIPARYASTRLPNKPLLSIHGKPMVIYVLENAHKSGAERVIVATDHQNIARTVEKAGGEVCMTRIDHKSGVTRLAEVIEKYNFSDDTIIVNVQSDEPTIQSLLIKEVAENLIRHHANVTTLASPIHSIEEIFDPNKVKVVLNKEGFALYFSRSKIPWCYDGFFSKKKIKNIFLRHLGIYSYRAEFIRRYVSWKSSPLEEIEMLEQLRVLWYGEKIYVAITEAVFETGIDTEKDLKRIRNTYMKSDADF